tara:strand:- start:5333 stop:8764 length:3432 start_codon:yes stop_codon:yes gene_type:complete
MPGILDYNKTLAGFGPYSTSDYRDMLLGRNLPPPVSDTLSQAGLTTYLQDIGKVVNVPIWGTQDENIPLHYDEDKKLFPLGIFYRDTKNVNNNQFAPLNDNYGVIGYSDYINPIPPIPGWTETPPKGPYPTQYNEDNFDLINKGDKKGVVNPYTVIDRYQNLNLTKESSLGLVGGEELQISVSNKIAQVETDKTDSITTGLFGVDEYINRINGTQSYFNTLSNDAVGWQEYNSNSKDNQIASQLQKVNSELGNYTNPSLSTEARVNSLLEKTSAQQVGFLLTSFQQNLYVPNYTDRRMVGTSEEGTNSRYYIGSERSTNRGATITQVFQSDEFNGADGLDSPDTTKTTTVDEKFFWNTGDQSNFNEKTLLYKTQKLVDEHPDGVWINQTKKYFKDKTEDKLISRGNAISKFSLIEAEANGNFCRVWTVNDNYNYLNAIRNTGLFSSPDPTLPGFSVTNEKASLSVLNDNGFVKTHPTKDDSKTTFKKFMLSLENLAWADNLADLPLNEIGPGDILSGNKGRIMWFPPYDLRFDESVAANWNKTDFIGRGEPVFTYNNTNRTGQLSFKVLVDHPRVINGYRGKRTDAIERFFAGCITPTQFLEFLDKNSSISQNQKDEITKKYNEIQLEKVSNTTSIKETFEFQFDTDESDTWTPSSTASVVSKIQTIINGEDKVKITVEGFAGSDDEQDSQQISTLRANAVWSSINNGLTSAGVNSSDYSKQIIGKGEPSSSSPSDRRVMVTVQNDALKGKDINHKDQSLGDLSFYPEEVQLIDSLVIDENGYFEFVDANFPNYFSTISEKIKYFHPGFHSMTPEGLNTRLTFLQQCMRQGPSIYDDKDTVQPQNLAFGRPPICILRIGDFFHTKIVINSLNITYEAGNGIQWDMNPSGIGVQPMMANVTMSIDLIGGHSLLNPINRLQNALSFNFYANTEMYDVRADSVDKSTGTIVDGLKLGQMKENALGPEGLLKVTDSLKQEGIVKQEEDSKKTGSETGTPPNNTININKKDNNKIVVATPDDNKKIKVKVQTQDTPNNFKDVLNKTQNKKEKEYDLTSYISNYQQNYDRINQLQIDNGILQSERDSLSLNTSYEIQRLNEIDTLMTNNRNTIKKLESKPNQVKILAIYEDDKGSETNKLFTYTTNGLT